MATTDDRQQATSLEQLPGPELRLLDRRAFVGFPSLTLAPGVEISDFGLQVPDVTFPFDFSGGATRFQRKTLLFGFLELTVKAEQITRAVVELAEALPELTELRVAFRPGFLEGSARLGGVSGPPVTFKVAFDGDGERLAVYLYDVRLYGFSPTPAARVPVLLSRGLASLGALPEVEPLGASGFVTRLLPMLVQRAAVSRGFKLPSLEQARLSVAEITSQGLKLRFASGGVPPAIAGDEALMLAMEGTRAFAEAEALLAEGRLEEAREAYLRHGDAHEAHPFAAERLLCLLVADPQTHELALDVAASLARRQPGAAAPLWAEAVVRERRGEPALAAERYLALCDLSRRGSEESSAFFAAESAARVGREQAPRVVVRALHELLGLKPDHLPSLLALAKAADQANDRAGAIRAYRRIAALARDPAEAADAHVQMARLCAETEDDVAGARLHCEAALRLAPEHPDALWRLGELCHRAGEPMRALKSLDRLREVALGRHELERVGRADLLCGRVWEEGLEQLDNALLRYREAVSLLPSVPEAHWRLGGAAEKLGKLQEALGAYQTTVELCGPAPSDPDARRAGHSAHHALARLFRERLADPVRAREHLLAAFSLEPRDEVALEALIPWFRASGKAEELADACEKSAQLTDAPERRAELWAEAGELYRGRLGDPERAERLLSSALEADPSNRRALEGMLAIADARRDGAQLCRCLKALAAGSRVDGERAGYLRRLALCARELTFDLELAVEALEGVLTLEANDLPALGELCALHRRRADGTALASALERRAAAAESLGDRRLATAALRELAQLLEMRLGRLGEALVALEKAARLSPEAGVLMELAELALRCERPDHARRALEDLLRELPANAPGERRAQVHLKLGEALEQLGRPEQAVIQLEKALELGRPDEQLLSRMEALYQQTGRTEALGSLLEARARLAREGGAADEAARLSHRAAALAAERGDTDAAHRLLTAALDDGPDRALTAEVLERLAELELAAARPEAAARHMGRRAALLDDPLRAARLCMRAATLVPESTLEAELLTLAIERAPDHPRARVLRAERLLADRPREALVELEAALAAEALAEDALGELERITLLRRAALAAREAGELATARVHLGHFVARRPDDLEAAQELLELHRSAGDDEQVCDLLEELLARLPEQGRQAATLEHARLALKLGREEAACASLRTLTSDEAYRTEAAGLLLELLPPDDRGDEAADTERLALLLALEEDASGGRREELRLRRARTLVRLGRREEGKTLLAEVASGRADAELHVELAGLCRGLDDPEGECQAWAAAVRLEPARAKRAGPALLALAGGLAEGGELRAARRTYEAAIHLPLPEDSASGALHGLAELARSDGDLEAAAAALQAASLLGPRARRLEACLGGAALFERLEDPALALELLERARELEPGHGACGSSLRRLYRDLGEWESLAELLASEAARADRPEAARLQLELGLIYLEELALPGPAEAALRRSMLLADDADGWRPRAALLRLRAARAPEEVVELIREVEEHAPGEVSLPLFVELGEAALHRAERGPTLALLRAALRVGSDMRPPPEQGGLARRLLAEQLYLAGAVEEALPLLREAFVARDDALRPEDVEVLGLPLAELELAAGRSGEAREVLEEIVRLRPHRLEPVERLAELLESDAPRAALDLRVSHLRGLADGDRTAGAFSRLAAEAADRLLDPALATSLWREAIERSEDPLPHLRALAEHLSGHGRLEERLEVLEIMSARFDADGASSDALEALDLRAELLERMGRLSEATDALERTRDGWSALGEEERAATAALRHAEILRDARGDLPGALAALERAWELRTRPELARMALSIARTLSDPRAEARWLERLVEGLVGEERLEAELRRAELLEAHGDLDAAEALLRAQVASSAPIPDAEGGRAFDALRGFLGRHGHVLELAAMLEEAAERATDPDRRVEYFREAATLYAGPLERPEAAAAALLAARGSRPDDLRLTEEVAALLREAGREHEAAEYDALLLEADPERAEVFERQAAFLEGQSDLVGLAHLLLRRAEGREGEAAVEGYLAAADVLRRDGAEEQALLCEREAFERCPSSLTAFERLRARCADAPSREAELLSLRARAVDPEEAVSLLRQRAALLDSAGESLLAAEAFDELLELAGEDIPALARRSELAFEAGGAAASRPYDRRLLAAGGDSLPVPLRVRTTLRVGHAALDGAAYVDAADAFEVVASLDPGGEKGREALNLLAETYARSGDRDGQFSTSLRLVELAPPEEVEALLRHAAGVFEDPSRSIEALVPLSRLRPADAGVIDRAADGLARAGRFGDLLELYERSAEASGGPRAAELLSRAANVARTELFDPSRAEELLERAASAAPDEVGTLLALLEVQRSRGDRPAILESLLRLASADTGPERASRFREACELASGPEELGRLVDVARGLDAADADVAREALLVALRERPLDERLSLTRRVADAFPQRAPALLRELFEVTRAQEEWSTACELADALVPLLDDRAARAALHFEQGELLYGRLGEHERARNAYERSLADAPDSVGTVRRLVQLLAEDDEPLRFATLTERLGELAGEAAVEPFLPALADAYEALGRTDEACEILGRLPGSPEVWARRARLFSTLGRVVESLQQRELYETDAFERERIAYGYLEAGVLPQAARLVRSLLREGASLSASTRRSVAERLSVTPDDPQLAVTLWPALIEESAFLDADGWTLHARALAAVGERDASRLVESFAAAVGGSTRETPRPEGLRPDLLEAGEPSPRPRRATAPVALSDGKMPRLHAALREVSDALGLGAGDAAVPAGASAGRDDDRGEGAAILDLDGPLGAWEDAEGRFVLGAGALAAFGPVELGYLRALVHAAPGRAAIATGGQLPPGLLDAATVALRAFPSARAAWTVLEALGGGVASREARRLPDAAVERLARAVLEAVARTDSGLEDGDGAVG